MNDVFSAEPIVAMVSVWILVAFFALGAVINFVAPKFLRENYARWGYPAWFHRVTAAFELVTAFLLVFPATRLPGAILGAVVMLAAATTTLRHREYTHSLAPLTALLLTSLTAGLIVHGG